MPLLDVVERPEDGERGREGGQHDHEQADSVETECVIHTPRGDPGSAALELIPTAERGIVGPPESHAQDKNDEAPTQGQPLGPILGSPEYVDHAEDRKPNQDV